jgi:hypothetical protein
LATEYDLSITPLINDSLDEGLRFIDGIRVVIQGDEHRAAPMSMLKSSFQRIAQPSFRHIAGRQTVNDRRDIREALRIRCADLIS